MPGGFVPEEDDEPFALLCPISHQRLQKLNRHFTVGLPLSPAQGGLLGLVIQRGVEGRGVDFLIPTLGHP